MLLAITLSRQDSVTCNPQLDVLKSNRDEKDVELPQDTLIENSLKLQSVQHERVKAMAGNKIKKYEELQTNLKYLVIEIQGVTENIIERNMGDKAAFKTSFPVFLLDLVLFLSSNLFTHMIRSYKNSVPHVKLNIIIVITTYIVELGNFLLIFQVNCLLLFQNLELQKHG